MRVGYECSTDVAGRVGVSFDNDGLRRCDHDTRPEHLAAFAGVVGSHEIWVGAQRSGSGQPKGSGAECGQDPTIGRDAAGHRAAPGRHAVT